MKMEAFGVMIPGLPFFMLLLLIDFAVSIAAALFDLNFIDLFDMIMNSKRNMNK